MKGLKTKGGRLERCAPLFSVTFTGDLALARGLDQVLHYHTSPQLYEEAEKDAREYVRLAWQRLKKEKRSHQPFSFVMGDLILTNMYPHFEKPRDLWISNLETSLTRSTTPFPKGINYKTHPKNVYFLLELQKHVRCPLLLSLANNHVLDWQQQGLQETLLTLQRNHLPYIGAGRNLEEASRPFVLTKNLGRERCVVFAVCHPSSGVPLEWSATDTRPGVFVLPSLASFVPVFKQLTAMCQPTDVKILTLHWGPNWQDRIDPVFQTLCHSLVDDVGFRVILNSSPHHIMPIEKYKDAVICYSPGDFINDYYGIQDQQHTRFQPDMGETISVSLSHCMPEVRVQTFQRIGFQLQPLFPPLLPPRTLS
jgi:poly-gamma-glutamate capsule biosynthesis protein CapA/YwtB (metallophosphatase superfamily)